MPAFPLKQEVEYPSSDGKPMAETDLHRDEMFYAIFALKEHFRQDPGVYVSGNLLLYYVEGDPRYSISPDALVAKGLVEAKERRDIYKVWEEGCPPCWVMEVSSKKTRMEDLHKKKSLYKRLGVEEYFLFDPRHEYLDPPLQGHRLIGGPGGRYEPLAPEPDGSVVSPGLGLIFRREEDGLLRILDARTGAPLRRPEEETEARQAAEEGQRTAEARAAQETEARQALEAEVARLRRQLGQT